MVLEALVRYLMALFMGMGLSEGRPMEQAPVPVSSAVQIWGSFNEGLRPSAEGSHEDRDSVLFCSGTLVGHDLILTSAHCFFGLGAPEFVSFAPKVSQLVTHEDWEQWVRPVSDFKFHPEWQGFVPADDAEIGAEEDAGIDLMWVKFDGGLPVDSDGQALIEPSLMMATQLPGDRDFDAYIVGSGTDEKGEVGEQGWIQTTILGAGDDLSRRVVEFMGGDRIVSLSSSKDKIVAASRGRSMIGPGDSGGGLFVEMEISGSLTWVLVGVTMGYIKFDGLGEELADDTQDGSWTLFEFEPLDGEVIHWLEATAFNGVLAREYPKF